MKLHQIIEDFTRFQVILDKRPRSIIDNLLALFEQSLSHFHQLGPAHDILPVVYLACRVDVVLILFQVVADREGNVSKVVHALVLKHDRVLS